MLSVSILLGVTLSMSPPSVIVIGGGSAGVGAVSKLHADGVTNFKVLEATADTIGGRMKMFSPPDPTKGGTYNDLAGLYYEEGAAWIKGTVNSDNHPLKGLVEAANLETKTIDWNSYQVLDSAGADITVEFNAKQELLKAAYVKAIADCDKMTASQNGVMDISFGAMLRKYGWVATTPLERMVEWRAIDFEYASMPMHVSCAHHSRFTYDHFGNSDEAVIDARGFSQILETKLEALIPGYRNDDRFLFGKKVTKIDSSVDREVTVTCGDGSTYKADFVLVAVPLGVLQGGEVEFVPALPEWKSNQIQNHAVASIVKVFATYDPAATAFWPTDKLMTIIVHDTQGGRWGSIMTLHVLTGKAVHKSTIVATLVGTEGQRLDWMTDASILTEFNAMITSVFSSNMEPVHFHVTRWGTNPLFKGAQSSWNIGYESSGHKLAFSPHGTVFFAGEHTSEFYSGSVSGAYDSGAEAAKRIYECTNNYNNGDNCLGTGDYLLKSTECQASSFIRFTTSTTELCPSMLPLEQTLESQGDVVLQNTFFYELGNYNVAYKCKEGRDVETLQTRAGYEIIIVVATHLTTEELLKRIQDAREPMQQYGLSIEEIVVSLDPVTIILALPPSAPMPIAKCDDGLPEYGIVLISILCLIIVGLSIVLAYHCHLTRVPSEEDPTTSPDQADQA